MKVYLSGPITGLDDKEVKENFHKAALEVAKMFPSADIISPYALCRGMPFKEWKDFMQICLKILSECDMIYMMKDWALSYGCMTEYYFAAGCKIRTLLYDKDN